MAQVDKAIVTNVGALKAKYGAGYTRIEQGIKKLIAADKKRGVSSALIALDNAATMKRFKAKPVAVAREPWQNKEAIDAVDAALRPDYILILGAVDVVPHQVLTNPAEDDDIDVPSDLPYACEAPYSTRPEDFRGPTRVVGRLPDLTGGSATSYLTGLLGVAASYQTRPRSDYNAYFGLSVVMWQKSTALSLRNTFGNDDDLLPAPPKGWKFSDALLARRAHFINCHGGEVDSFFYGQKGKKYPRAHSAAYLQGRVSEGTIVAAECCYGAQLYDPADAQGQASICNTYLAGKAYGYFGSSTVAYGPSSGNGSADLICQFFLAEVLRGASLGRAGLEARQKFVQSAAVLDPYDLKTLAQFSLMGDPSIHPVEAQRAGLTATKAFSKAFAGKAATAVGRGVRRERLLRTGVLLANTARAARKSATLKPSAKVRKVLDQAVRESKISGAKVKSFSVHDPAKGALKFAKAARAKTSAIHVAVGKVALPKGTPVRPWVGLVATVEDGEIVRFRRVHCR